MKESDRNELMGTLKGLGVIALLIFGGTTVAMLVLATVLDCFTH